jgi:hypothetical protein
MRCSIILNMIYRKELNEGLTTTGTYRASIVGEDLPFHL